MIIDEFIYGKSKTNLPWPIFLDFIITEKELFKKLANEKISEIPKKIAFQNFTKIKIGRNRKKKFYMVEI